jgi:hypothetical protein
MHRFVLPSIIVKIYVSPFIAALTKPNGWRLSPLRNSSPPNKRVVIAPGGNGPLGRIRIVGTILAGNL